MLLRLNFDYCKKKLMPYSIYKSFSEAILEVNDCG
jgi:hypothetical protein